MAKKKILDYRIYKLEVIKKKDDGTSILLILDRINQLTLQLVYEYINKGMKKLESNIYFQFKGNSLVNKLLSKVLIQEIHKMIKCLNF